EHEGANTLLESLAEGRFLFHGRHAGSILNVPRRDGMHDPTKAGCLMAMKDYGCPGCLAMPGLRAPPLLAEQPLPPGQRRWVRFVSATGMRRVDDDEGLTGFDQAEDPAGHELNVLVGAEVVADLL